MTKPFHARGFGRVGIAFAIVTLLLVALGGLVTVSSPRAFSNPTDLSGDALLDRRHGGSGFGVGRCPENRRPAHVCVSSKTSLLSLQVHLSLAHGAIEERGESRSRRVAEHAGGDAAAADNTRNILHEGE